VIGIIMLRFALVRCSVFGSGVMIRQRARSQRGSGRSTRLLDACAVVVADADARWSAARFASRCIKLVS